MAIEFSIFPVEKFSKEFSRFYENEAKHDKHNFEKGLTVTRDIQDQKFVKLLEKLLKI